MEDKSSVDAGPFSGVGVFTTHDPETALKLKGKADWVAVQAHEATAENVQALKDAGFKVVVWEAEASQAGINAVNQFNADGYIAQSEGPGQLKAAMEISAQVNVPKALVTNLDSIGSWPPGWVCMPEAYQNTNAQSTPEAMVSWATHLGAETIIPVLGNYDASGENPSSGKKIGVDEYLPGLERSGVDSYAMYSAEYLTQEDINAVSPLSSSQQDTPLTATDDTAEKDSPAPAAQLETAEHSLPGRRGWPPAYTAGAGGEEWLRKHPQAVRFETDSKGRKVTYTTTASGAVIQHVEGGSPYQVKAAPSSKEFVPDKEAAAVDGTSDNLETHASSTARLEKEKHLNELRMERFERLTGEKFDIPAAENITPAIQPKTESINHSSPEQQYSPSYIVGGNVVDPHQQVSGSNTNVPPMMNEPAQSQISGYGLPPSPATPPHAPTVYSPNYIVGGQVYNSGQPVPQQQPAPLNHRQLEQQTDYGGGMDFTPPAENPGIDVSGDPGNDHPPKGYGHQYF